MLKVEWTLICHSSIVVICCDRAVTWCDRAVTWCDRAGSQCDRAVSQFDSAVGQFDRVVSQCDRAMSFGRYGRGFGGSFYVKLCILLWKRGYCEPYVQRCVVSPVVGEVLSLNKVYF